MDITWRPRHGYFRGQTAGHKKGKNVTFLCSCLASWTFPKQHSKTVKQLDGWQLVTSLQLAGCLYSWKWNKYCQTAGLLTTCHQPAAAWLLLLLKIKSVWSNSRPVDNLSQARTWPAACTLENQMDMVKQPASWQLVTSPQMAGCLYSWKFNGYGQTAGRLTTCHQPAAGWLLVLLKLNWYGQTAGQLTTCHQHTPGRLLVLMKLNGYGRKASWLTTCHQPAAGWLLVPLKIKSVWSNSPPVDNLSPALTWPAACTLEN